MTTNETARALHELKLPGMASCWESLEETHQLDRLTLRDGMQQMLQYERDTRQNNRIQRLVKNANFRLKATIEGKRIRDVAFFLIIMLVTFAATLLKPQKYVSSRTIQKCVEHVSTSTEP